MTAPREPVSATYIDFIVARKVPGHIAAYSDLMTLKLKMKRRDGLWKHDSLTQGGRELQAPFPLSVQRISNSLGARRSVGKGTKHCDDEYARWSAQGGWYEIVWMT